MLLLVKDVRMLVIYNVIPYSELAEPHKLLSYLLQQRIVSLSSDIIAVYVHAAMKVFGSWAAEHLNFPVRSPRCAFLLLLPLRPPPVNSTAALLPPSRHLRIRRFVPAPRHIGI